MTPQTIPRQRGNAAGKFITFVLVLALLGLGGWLVLQDQGKTPPDEVRTQVDQADEPRSNDDSSSASADAPTPIEPLTRLPTLDAAAAYQPKDGIIDVDISEYAGYAGLIVANGGLAPNPDSLFAKQYGFQVRLTLSEEEGWSKLNNGRIAASVTTADTLPIMGRQFEVIAPVQIGFSRGADMVVVDAGIPNINQLSGKVLASSQFNEAEFFIRYLASEAGVKAHGLTPRARVLGMATAGLEPRIMGFGPAPAVRKLLSKLNLTMDQMDVIELNEAFAAQGLAVTRDLGLADDDARINPNGGAIAMGHPLGMSGARLATTALYELHRRNARYALCTMCIGVGQGIALVIERV